MSGFFIFIGILALIGYADQFLNKQTNTKPTKSHTPKSSTSIKTYDYDEKNNETRNLEHIDMWGISTGYSIHSESTSFTIGVVFSKGTGLAQIYDNMPTAVKVKRFSATGLLSTNYRI